MKALAEALELLRPFLFVQANRMIFTRALQLQQAAAALQVRHVFEQRAREKEAARLADHAMLDTHLRGPARHREWRKAFNRFLRRLESGGLVRPQPMRKAA